MAYTIEIGETADRQLQNLDSAVGQAVERKILWLAEDASHIIHRRLVGLPPDLDGLSKFRIGDYRVLYWNYPDKELIRIYRVMHRSDVYRRRQ